MDFLTHFDFYENKKMRRKRNLSKTSAPIFSERSPVTALSIESKQLILLYLVSASLCKRVLKRSEFTKREGMVDYFFGLFAHLKNENTSSCERLI